MLRLFIVATILLLITVLIVFAIFGTFVTVLVGCHRGGADFYLK